MSRAGAEDDVAEGRVAVGASGVGSYLAMGSDRWTPDDGPRGLRSRRRDGGSVGLVVLCAGGPILRSRQRPFPDPLLPCSFDDCIYVSVPTPGERRSERTSFTTESAAPPIGSPHPAANGSLVEVMSTPPMRTVATTWR